MTEQDLADRLEKAKALANEFEGVLSSAKAKMVTAGKHSIGSARDAERRTTLREFGDEVFDIADEILASLRRSAPASGETRETVLAEIAALVRGVVYAEHYRAWPTLEVENRRNTDRVTVQCDILADTIYALRTPSGETGEEAEK